ncbi:ATP-binding cassette domain-containing protein [Corynebacterium kefirresidentii]|uniref:ATP-binding cassette domain-containing protein n=1 Tax=Corynebacterium TaxID=1716 RepID=UPI001EF16BBF|nr:ATP-binding cassette domain-containing protein [Corynebacterium kefirresidentii]MCG7451000.1 ATP-binding cassette domain-containing protein [Corynebacterium kefirresidentii]MCG7453347.1 ATP-binding cassette domain-containing protein [Corynebacterium kefirresidentii]
MMDFYSRSLNNELRGHYGRFEVLKERGKMDRGTKLHLNHVTQILGKTEVIQDLSITVPTGKVYGFLGRNGAGKSTVMKIILGLLRPDTGTVELEGRPVAGGDTSYLSHIGSLIEEPSFYPNLTGAENISYLGKLRGVKTNTSHILEMVGLSNHGKRKAGEYSLGMKQRLGIALALVGDPDILLLDEPTNGLDPDGIREIRELILRFSREMGKTVVVSSHILSEIEQVADVVGIIHEGSLRYEGELSSLIGAPSLVIDALNSSEVEQVLDRRGIPYSILDDGKIRLRYQDRELSSQIITSIVTEGSPIASATIQSHTLEDAFLTITGSADIEGAGR